MIISTFFSSILILALGIWSYMKLESSMNIFAEKQLLIEPSKFSYKMWKDMPVTMYQSFTFFNLTNWNQVKAAGQKPRFVEVGPYVYRTIWTKSEVNFMDEERLVSFSEKKQWIFQAHLSKGSEDDQIWTINTPLMTALALIQNAPVITRNIVSVILDGLGEGAFIKRNIRSLLFEGYSDLIVSVGPLFDRRFSNFNGKFAYLYNKNDSVDGQWTVSTGTEDLASLNKISRFQSSIVNMTSFSTGQLPQGLNEVKPECAAAWSLDQSTNGQLFAPFNKDIEQAKLQQQLAQLRASRSSSGQQVGSLTSSASASASASAPVPVTHQAPKRFFSRSANHEHQQPIIHQQDSVPNQHHFMNQMLDHGGRSQQLTSAPTNHNNHQSSSVSQVAANGDRPPQLKDIGKYIFYPDLCRPIHLLPGKNPVLAGNGIEASRYYIDPRVFMNSTQVPSNRCYEMNPRPALANALAATINSVTGANVAMPNLVSGASSPFAMFSPPSHRDHRDHHHHGEGGIAGLGSGLFERSNHPNSFLNNALHGFTTNQDQQASSSNAAPVSRLGRVRQLFTNIVSQRMSATGPGSLLPSLAAGPAGILIGNHFPLSSNSRNSPEEPLAAANSMARNSNSVPLSSQDFKSRQANSLDGLPLSSNALPSAVQASPPSVLHPPVTSGGSDRWITQFRFKWPKGVFSIGQCQLGAPIYASLPHFLDADEYYLEQVDGLKPNRSLHEFYIDIESTLHSIPVGAKARLQLNVATPELRFRNIPNAMIPVLWQEVTFEIDKPIATMLYWSFTMSSTLYKLVSILLLAIGCLLMASTFIGGFKKHRRNRALSSMSDQSEGSEAKQESCSSHSRATIPRELPEGQRSSWQPHMMPQSGSHNVRAVGTIICDKSLTGCVGEALKGRSSDTLDIIRHGAALNHAFSSCTELDHNSHHHHQHPLHHHLMVDSGSNSSSSSSSSRQTSGSGPTSSTAGLLSTAGIGGGSPKQPSSRADSHCELVSSLGAAVNCTGCLLACLRHSTNSKHHLHDHLEAASDNSLVRPQVTSSDIDKTTLSSRNSNLDSCSSIYTQRIKNFK